MLNCMMIIKIIISTDFEDIGYYIFTYCSINIRKHTSKHFFFILDR